MRVNDTPMFLVCTYSSRWRCCLINLELEDRVALITASSKGIGRAVALALAKEGCNVAICARGGELLQQTRDEIAALGVDVLAVEADITEPDQIDRLVDETTMNFGRNRCARKQRGCGGRGTFVG